MLAKGTPQRVRLTPKYRRPTMRGMHFPSFAAVIFDRRVLRRARMRSSAVARLISILVGLAFAGASAADEYSDGWGPAVGSIVGDLGFVGADGAPVQLSEVQGTNGTLLFLNRSADW